mgnify:CR=1 FL=1
MTQNEFSWFKKIPVIFGVHMIQKEFTWFILSFFMIRISCFPLDLCYISEIIFETINSRLLLHHLSFIVNTIISKAKQIITTLLNILFLQTWIKYIKICFTKHITHTICMLYIIYVIFLRRCYLCSMLYTHIFNYLPFQFHD